MRPLYLVRLFFDAMAAGLLLAAIAYDWLGNFAHELFGTALFLLLAGHVAFNRCWFTMIARGWREPRLIFSKAITLSLTGLMLGLLVTSILISHSVFSFIPHSSPFVVRQTHALVAYVILFVVALHIGLQWSTIMRAIGRTLGIVADNRVHKLVIRSMAGLIAAYGIYSIFVIDIRSKLLMELTLDVWDFQRAALAFFIHLASIVGLGAIFSHYFLKLLSSRW